MTTELEQKFYDTFGIKKICTHTIINPEKCNHRRMTRCCGCDWLDYPKITAEKLLEMICIAMKYKNTYRFVNGIEDLKEQTLKILISLKDMLSIYAEIQQLFKEDNQ